MCVIRKVGKVHPIWVISLVILLLPLFLDLLSRLSQQVSLWLFGIDSHPLVELLVTLAVSALLYFIWERLKRQRPTQKDTDVDNELERLQREKKKR